MNGPNSAAAVPVAAHILRGSGFILRLLSRAILGVILLFLLAEGLSLFKDAKNFGACRRIIALEQSLGKPSQAYVRAHLPTNFKGQDVSVWVLLLGTYVVFVMLGQIGVRLRLRAEALEGPRLRGDSDILGDLSQVDRSQLLEIYAQTKKTLDLQKRVVAFLSIDVVNSTGLKAGEDPGLADRDFRQYRQMVEGIFKSNEVLKATWTPDGVMACFEQPAAAVKTGQEVLLALAGFNRNVKSIRRDFQARAGVNAGIVFYDPALPLEQLSDRAIDIAGHMQKYAEPDTVAASKAVVDALPPGMGFQPASRQVDGLDVCQWRAPAPETA